MTTSTSIPGQKDNSQQNYDTAAARLLETARSPAGASRLATSSLPATKPPTSCKSSERSIYLTQSPSQWSLSDSFLKEIKILIHLIDGFEIEEADSPFPIAKGELPEGEAEDKTIETAMKRRLACGKVGVASRHGLVGTEGSTTKMMGAPPPAKIAKQSAQEVTTISTEVKCEKTESPTKNRDACQNPDGPAEAKPTRTRQSGSGGEEEEDSISIGSKELLTREEMMNEDYASSPRSHSPVSFPLRDVSSTDSFPSSYHQLDNVEEMVDEKPAIFLCEPDVDKNIVDWSEQDVYHFISGIEGCSQYAEEFISQEIDGQALVLLNEDHLMSNLNVKLGPALKILAKIQESKK